MYQDIMKRKESMDKKKKLIDQKSDR